MKKKTSILFVFSFVAFLLPSFSLCAQLLQLTQAEGNKQTLEKQASQKKFLHELTIFQWLLKNCRTKKDLLCEGHALMDLGIVYGSFQQSGSAIESLNQASQIFQKFGKKEAEIQSLVSIASIYNREIARPDKALIYYQKALAISHQLTNRQWENNLLIFVAIVYTDQKMYVEALNTLEPALKISQKSGNRKQESNVLLTIAKIKIDQGQYDNIPEYLQQALLIAREIKDLPAEIEITEEFGNYYVQRSQYAEAIESYQQAINLARQFKILDSEAKLLVKIGKTYSSEQKTILALENFLEALKIAQKSLDIRFQVDILNNIGDSYQETKQLDKALQTYQQSLAIAEKSRSPRLQVFALATIGHFFDERDKEELAIIFLKRTVNTIELIRTDQKKLSKEERQAYTNRYSFLYRKLADRLLQKGRIIEALQVLDLLKTQELNDYLKNINGSDRSIQNVRFLEPEISISKKLLEISFDQISQLNQQLASQIQKLPESEINKVPEYLQNIPQGNVLLYPLILEDRLEIVLFSPNTTPVHRTVNIKKEEFEDLVFAYRLYLKDPKTLKIKDASKQLYDVLIKPIEEDLKLAKATTILYSPDDVLRYVPLAALYDGKQWLVEKYRISNLIAYNLTDFTPKAKSSPNILAGAYGNGNSKTGQIPLPATIKEVSAISNTFPNTVNLIESAFSLSATEAQTPKHNILHLATHAEFNGNPNTSFIYFGNGDTISLSNIKDWKMSNIDLIVLSACQTGSGKLGNGIEILGFGYQVQLAGAKASIASLWKVSDEGTQALMKSFYENIKQGDRPTSEALRQAQIDTIRSQQFTHPFYWSAFILIGSGL